MKFPSSEYVQYDHNLSKKILINVHENVKNSRDNVAIQEPRMQC